MNNVSTNSVDLLQADLTRYSGPFKTKLWFAYTVSSGETYIAKIHELNLVTNAMRRKQKTPDKIHNNTEYKVSEMCQ